MNHTLSLVQLRCRIASPAANRDRRLVCAAKAVDSVDPVPSTSAARRDVLLAGISSAGLASLRFAPSAQAGFKKELKKKKLTEADYVPSDAVGLGIFELAEGTSGPAAKEGDRVIVHFDVMYRGLDVVSSRASRLLGANRTIAEPYEFIVGEPVSAQAARKITDSAGGLFSGSGGPKPPPILSKAVIGMRKGGKRSILVDKPELGYGVKGIGELPPNTTFELKVEVLEIVPK